MSNLKVRQLTIDAMLAAMCAVLGMVSIDLYSIKLTFEGFPVIVGALLFGPLDGALIGGVGTFVYQILKYGWDATTLMWVAPYVVSGLFVGLVAKHYKFNMTRKQLIPWVLANELLVCVLNTVGIYFGSKIQGWYHPGVVTGMLLTRIVVAVAKGVAYGAILPVLLDPVKKLIRQQNGKKKGRSVSVIETKTKEI